MLMNLVLLSGFGFAFINNLYAASPVSLHNLTFFSIAVLSGTTLYLLVKNNKKAIVTCTLAVLIMLSLITYSLFRTVFSRGYSKDSIDYIMPPIIYSIVFGYLFLIHIFKYNPERDHQKSEIDQIGQIN